MTTTITDYCSGNGYDLLADYQADSCGACHSDNTAKSEYTAGNYEFFCPAPAEPTCTDADADGYFVEGESCGTAADFDDGNDAAYPGATEICTDGVDNDGNGLTDTADPNAIDCPVECTDMDADGYATEGGACGAIDCNDNDDSINPGAAEICSDNIDNNCNNLTDTADSNAVDCPVNCTDSDSDGYSIEGGSCGAVDCDDSNADINPGALEVCGDGLDNNCNELVDTADSVCSNDEMEDGDDKPWWRSRDKHRRHHHHHDRCERRSRDDYRDKDDYEDNEDEDEDEGEDDDEEESSEDED
ncbi:MAG: putative metal-binding motif-containing protein [Candidatus Thiodiazotropha sp.]